MKNLKLFKKNLNKFSSASFNFLFCLAFIIALIVAVSIVILFPNFTQSISNIDENIVNIYLIVSISIVAILSPFGYIKYRRKLIKHYLED